MDGEADFRAFLPEALSVGFLGAAAVALWFFIVDMVGGEFLRTPGILGSALFLGISSPDEAVINLYTVGLYTLVHGFAFFAVGIGVTALVRAADRTPSTLGLIIPLTVVLEVLFVGGVAIIAEFILGALAWWSVLGGNFLASFLMGFLLLHWYPSLIGKKSASEAFSST